MDHPQAESVESEKHPASGGGTGSAASALPLEIASLTSLRGIAAAWVVMLHLWSLWLALWPEADFLTPLVKAGGLAVPLFFVLSGYVLGLRYLPVLRSPTRLTLYRFWWLRLGRIYPVHACTLLITVAVLARRGWPPGESLETLAANAFLVHAWGHEFRMSWNYPAWSISSEWFAYLIFPFVAMLLARVGRIWRWGFVVLACGASALVYAFSEDNPPFEGLLVVIPTFIGGVSMASVIPVSTSETRRYWDVLCLLGCLALPFVVPHGPLQNALYVVIFFPLVGVLGASRENCSAFWRHRAVVYLGEISYSLYMTHAICINLFVRFLPIEALTSRSLIERVLVLVACLVIVLAASLAMYYAVERPMRHWSRQLARREAPLVAK